MKSRFLFYAALMLMLIPTTVNAAYALDGIPLTSNEQHYARSMTGMMMVLFMCPTGNYTSAPALMENLASKSSTPDRTKTIATAIGAEVKNVVERTDSPNLDPEIGRIFNQVMDSWRSDRSDDHRSSCKAAGDMLVEDGVAIKAY
ncbi:hypothetical protein ACFIOY_21780 [Bradyrhizobium sp. TZ2]